MRHINLIYYNFVACPGRRGGCPKNPSVMKIKNIIISPLCTQRWGHVGLSLSAQCFFGVLFVTIRSNAYAVLDGICNGALTETGGAIYKALTRKNKDKPNLSTINVIH